MTTLLQQEKKRAAIRETLDRINADPECDCFPEAKKHMEGGESDDSLGGGRWWRNKVKPYLRELDEACLNVNVTAEQFQEKLNGLYLGVKSGCQRWLKIKALKEERRANQEEGTTEE